MTNEVIIITHYKNSDGEELLRLLLELHVTHYGQSAPEPLQELEKEFDISKSYADYVAEIGNNEGGVWQVFLAKTSYGETVGFIIGRIDADYALLSGVMGILEDWYIKPDYRGQGNGILLFNELEKWFRERGCQQILSDTWAGNELSSKVHLHLGFFESGIRFRKKL
jgi:GNAT superfamily N-acetyltransferase